MRVIFLFSITMALLTAAFFGQQSPSAAPKPIADVLGGVTDKDGADVPHAEVIFSQGSETVRAYTTKNGFFHVKLRSGHYSVIVSAVGLKSTKVVNFRVEAPGSAVLNVVLYPATPGMVD